MNTPVIVLVTSLLSICGHVVFSILLLQKWEELEDANGGAALNFTNVSSVHTGDPVGPEWSIVFAPLWFSEACVVLVSSLAMYMAIGVSRNTRLLHMNSNAQAIGAAIFKVTLMQRLQTESGSWLNAFSPMYASMMVQSLLHYHKEADARGKRPGFPLGIPHLLALVVSFKLDGAFNYDESSWANVLWCDAAAAVRGPFRPFSSLPPLTPSSPRRAGHCGASAASSARR